MAKHEKPHTDHEPEPEVEETQVEVTQAEHAHAEHKSKSGTSHLERFKTWFVGHKLLAIPAGVLVLILMLIGIPTTRYALAGSVVKKDLTVKVVDATANTPVSGALVTAGGISVQTNGDGVARLPKMKAGSYNVSISKKYYKGSEAKASVPIFGTKAWPLIQISATGRQVKITITNKINKKPLSDVNIAVADITAKTDKNGNATIVLPAGNAQQSASLKLDGYVSAKVNVKVSNGQVQQNSFDMSPAGKVYFLSKLSGKIDVVKTNLDGTDRETVLAGTGNEDEGGTVLLASRDWKYLALLSKRAGTSPSIYMIDTSDDSLSTIDEGSVNFQLLGWSDNYFTYAVYRPDVPSWKPNSASIKSYNAPTKQLSTLDSLQSTGSTDTDAVFQSYGKIVLIDDLLVYSTQWGTGTYSSSTLEGQNNAVSVVKPDGGGKKTLKSWPAMFQRFNILSVNTPSSVLLTQTTTYGTLPIEYELSSNGLNQKDLSDNDLYKTYPTYLFSPNDKQTFWSESRDGKNTLFIGDQDGQNGKQIATLSDYKPYGWFSDNYLLLSKNASELYIMPDDGKNNPIKISDYHKPDQSYYGYGGGYGGI